MDAGVGGLSRSCALVAERRLMAGPSLSAHGARAARAIDAPLNRRIGGNAGRH